MKKFNKILTIIILALLGALGLSILITYLIEPDYVTGGFAYLVEILNKPLPIIGVTTLAVLVFVWRIIISTNYGKAKLLAYDKKVSAIEQAKNDFEKSANEKIKELEQDNDKLKEIIAHICELSTNKKIKDYGKEILEYGKDIDRDTTKE